MFLATAKNIFDIDNVGKRWPVRILYLLTVILNAAIYFNPWADTDFTPLYSWMNNVYNMTEYDPEVYNKLMTTMPLSKGNIVFILTVLVGELIYLCAAYIYAGIFVRTKRMEMAQFLAENGTDSINYAVARIPDEPIKPRKLFGRILLIMLMTILLIVPVVMISSSFMFLALIGLPFIFTAPIAYLSGDKGLFSSIPYVAKMSLRYYFINMRSIMLLLFIIIATDFLVPYISRVSYTAYYIVDAAVTTWIWLSIARAAASAYCFMKDFPIKGGRRPFAI